MARLNCFQGTGEKFAGRGKRRMDGGNGTVVKNTKRSHTLQQTAKQWRAIFVYCFSNVKLLEGKPGSTTWLACLHTLLLNATSNLCTTAVFSFLCENGTKGYIQHDTLHVYMYYATQYYYAYLHVFENAYRLITTSLDCARMWVKLS